MGNTDNMKFGRAPLQLNDPNKPYENLNKLPFLVWEYRSAMMKKFKEVFMQQLTIAQQNEKKACEATGGIPLMQGDLYKEVTNMLERCSTIFEIEALARFLFDDNEIPNWGQVQTRARLLENAFGIQVKR